MAAQDYACWSRWSCNELCKYELDFVPAGADFEPVCVVLSGGSGCELAQGGLQSGQDSGGGCATGGSKVVAVRVRHSANDVVSAKQAEFATDPRGAAASFGGRGRQVRKGEPLQITIAEAIEGELAAADGSQQLAVIGCEGA
jgi:hypothetical protein